MRFYPPAKVLVTGRNGRMGRLVIQAVNEASNLILGATSDQGDNLLALPSDLHVAIDFTSPDALFPLTSFCVDRKLALVTGTTGLEENHHRLLRDAATKIPVLWASNMSIGVNLMVDLVQRSVSALGTNADVEVVELHHRHKADAPSGTALTLLQTIANARHTSAANIGKFTRHGRIGPRAASEVGVQTLRGGDVVGEHTVYLLLNGERIEITHRATDRSIFASGAIRAAEWLIGKEPGLYSITDVLQS
ncbi:MAG: 4-hydroxy-tetrahydrodipicolinate reductase [Myxococcales bacterium]|nr:4-hydroxy-tetrahydrodipicolinate reductase [Myxococcales bacterium]